jgi:hypothetical protein
MLSVKTRSSTSSRSRNDVFYRHKFRAGKVTCFRGPEGTKSCTCKPCLNPETQYNRQITTFWVDRGSSDGIGSLYGLDGPGIESRWRRNFPYPTTGARRASCTINTGSVSRGLKRPWRGVNHPTHLAPRLKKECTYTSTPPLGFYGLF